MNSFRVDYPDGTGYDLYYEKHGRYYVLPTRMNKRIGVYVYSAIRRISKANYMAMEETYGRKGE